MRKLIIFFTLFTCFISFGQLRVIEDNNYNPTLLNEAIPFYNNGVIVLSQSATLGNKNAQNRLQDY